MAATKKNSSSRQKTNNKKKSNTVQQTISPYQDEIILIVALVVSILLALSTFQLGGLVGKFVNDLLFGLFGFMGYLFPYFIFLSVAFFISNRRNRSAQIKLFSSILLYIIMMGLSHLVIYGYKKGFHIFEFYKACSEGKNGGGLIGGLISNSLCYLFGQIGTYAILIGIGLILIMFITERLLFAGLNRKRKEIKERRKKERQERQLYYEEDTIPISESKRKANVFTFSKEDKEEIKNPIDRWKEKKKQNELEKETAVSDMEEIKPTDGEVHEPNMEHLNIVRDSTSVDQSNGTPAYQEALKNKFKKDENTKVLAEKISKKEKEIFSNEENNSTIVEKKEEAIPKQEIKEPVKEEKQKEDKVKEKSEPNEVESISSSIIAEQRKQDYVFPSIDLLSKPKGNEKGIPDIELKMTAAKLQSTLESFGVRVEMKNVSCGPAVTRYELQPAQGVKVSKITSLADDIKLSLAAADIRIEAPIPGKAAVGIEVPNKENTAVMLRSLLENEEFKNHPSNIAFAVGKDIGGKTVVTDIAKMPHLLIAGATGSGKSVCINTLIMSILYKSHPDDVKLIMVDPKVVELSVYNGIPHLLIPVVTDPKKASGALNWAVMEMTERYKKFADLGVRDMKGYNTKIATLSEAEQQDGKYQKMPQIVIIVDELADLMMVAPGEVEDAICRLAQMARAAGLHLIIATQRPSVNVITGLIKANVPSRIAFSVSSAIDSRTILDGSGAEKLLGKGDMLFFPSGIPKPIRVQGAFVSDKEVSAVVEFLSSQNGAPVYNEEVNEKIVSTVSTTEASAQTASDKDEYFVEAGRFIIEKDKASIGMLQRVYKIGFNRAARIMDQLYEAGVVGPEEGTKPRKVIMSLEEFETYVDEYV